jgi:hypothetical protein
VYFIASVVPTRLLPTPTVCGTLACGGTGYALPDPEAGLVSLGDGREWKVGRLVSEKPSYKIPLVFEPQPEGGYTVTCPILPELVTEGDTIDEALSNVHDRSE